VEIEQESRDMKRATFRRNSEILGMLIFAVHCDRVDPPSGLRVKSIATDQKMKAFLSQKL
jgi:hypothetical protein